MFTAILGFLGIGATLLKAAIELLVPILKVVLGWLLDLLDFLVRRFIKEVKALFDVFPFLVLALTFLAGGLFLPGRDVMVEKTKQVTRNTTKKVTRSVPRVVKGFDIPNPFKILGID